MKEGKCSYVIFLHSQLMLVVQPTTGNYSTHDPKNSTITPSPH